MLPNGSQLCPVGQFETQNYKLKNKVTMEHKNLNTAETAQLGIGDVSNCLNTTVLPKYNCSNCASFMHKKLEKLETQTVGWYAVECRNLVHPLQDCILRGFEGHSEQPGFSQTLNK